MPKNNRRKLLVVGVCGVTCGGKTTIANQLEKALPGSKIFSQDDYFLPENDPKHIWVPELNHINFDVLSSLDMHKMYVDILNYIENQDDKNKANGSTPSDIQEIPYNKELKLKNIVIIEGFSIFNYKPMQDLFDLKYYFILNRDECFKRRQTRVYDPPDCPGYFEKCVWPEHLKQLEEVKNTLQNVTYFDEKSNNVLDTILPDILKQL